MSEQRASCCGPVDEATTEPAKSTKANDHAPDRRVAARDLVSQERSPSGLLQAVRRLFGRLPA